MQSNQNQTGTGNESYEERERRDLLQRITDFYLRFAYVPMFFGEPGQAAPAKRPETVVQKSKPKPITEETPCNLTELATAMNVSRWTVDRWKKHGYVFKFGRQTTLADCKQWLAKNAERLAGKVTRQEMEEAKRRLAAIKSR